MLMKIVEISKHNVVSLVVPRFFLSALSLYLDFHHGIRVRVERDVLVKFIEDK